MEEVAINPIIETPELTQDWETDSWREQTNLLHTRTQEKGAVQEFVAEVWLGGGLLQGWGH